MQSKFDELFESASAQIHEGRHRLDSVPVDGGRWPMTVVADVPAGLAEMLDQLTDKVVEFTGPDHFRTGHPDACHVTIRAMEPYREAARPDDALAVSTAAVMARIAAQFPPITMQFTGLTLSPGTVMAQLLPQDESVWRLMDALDAALGDSGSYERQFGHRDLTYINLIHFTGPIRQPHALIDWVSERRRVRRVTVSLDSLSLVRTRYADSPPRMRLERWLTTPLRGPSQPLDIVAPAARSSAEPRRWGPT